MITDTGEAAGDESKRNKMVEDSEEEPRSKIPTDEPPTEEPPAEDVPSPSASKLWNLPEDFDVYCINKFDIVTVGKEAGWPGQWEEVVKEETTEEQLLYSLQVKGNAMSDEAWQQHWAQIGPGLLANGWLESYPSVPLSQVEQITGVSFLTQAAAAIQGSELSDAVEKLSVSENSIPTENTVNLDPPDLSTLSIDDTTPKVDTSELVTADVQVADESQLQQQHQGQQHQQGQQQQLQQQQSFSNEEIVKMWSNFYNGYYWHCYQQFVGVVDGASQQSGVNLIEDYVAAKKCYEPADCLTTTGDDNTIPVESKANEKTEQSTATVSTVSEPVNEISPIKDNLIDVSASQKETQSCSHPEEGSKVESSDSQESGAQAKNNTTSHEHSSNELPDFKEHPRDEKPSDPEHLESRKESNSNLEQPENTKETNENEKGNNSNPEQLDNGKDDQILPSDNKKVTKKADTKHTWQLSKSVQYTSIVWALQEAGIISSTEDQTPCIDQVHCNGTGDKETDEHKDDDTTNTTPRAAVNTNCDAIPSSSSSSAITDTHDQSTKQSLKRKR